MVSWGEHPDGDTTIEGEFVTGSKAASYRQKVAPGGKLSRDLTDSKPLHADQPHLYQLSEDDVAEQGHDENRPIKRRQGSEPEGRRKG